MHPDFRAHPARDRIARLTEEARVTRLVRESRPDKRDAASRAVEGLVSLRLNRVDDLPVLEQLALLDGRQLQAGPFVVSELDGRIVAALPLKGGAPLADPFAPTAQLLPLLELRATQIRRVGLRSRLGLKLKLLPRRA